MSQEPRTRDQEVKLLAFMEATELGGPGRNLLQTMQRLRGRVDFALVAYVRGAQTSTPLIDAFRAGGLRVHVVREAFRYDPRALMRIARLVREERSDLLQAHNTKSRLYLGLLTGLGLVSRVPRLDWFHGETWVDAKQRMFNLLDRMLFRRARHVFVVAESQVDLLAGWGVPRNRITVIHNAIADCGDVTTEGTETRRKKEGTTDYTDGEPTNHTNEGGVLGSSFLVRGCGGRRVTTLGMSNGLKVSDHGWTQVDTDEGGVAEGDPSRQPTTKNKERRTNNQQPNNPTTNNQQPTPLRLLSIGRLSAEKGHRLFIEALATLEREQPGRFRLTLVGSGPEEEGLRRLVAESKLNGLVEMPGYRTDTDTFYRSADLFVLPSLTEGFPNVLLEAAAHGVPMMAFDVGGIARVFEDGREILLVRPSTAEALARAIQEVSADWGSALRRAAAAHARVCRDYSMEQRAEKLWACYGRLAQGRTSAAG